MSIVSKPSVQEFPPQKRKPIILNCAKSLSILKPLPPIFAHLADMGARTEIRQAAYDCLNRTK